MSNEEEIEVIEAGGPTKPEQYVDDNKKNIFIIVASLIVVIVMGFAYFSWYIPEQEQQAQSQMFIAEAYFRSDSLRLAVYGDDNYGGFLNIVSDFGGTPSGNLAKYYAGISLLNLGEYEDAIEQLESFYSDDYIVSAVALGAIGDANMELGNTADALKYYIKAANYNENSYTSPMYLFKAGIAAESTDDYKRANEIFTQLMNDFPDSKEGRDAVKYQARAEAKNQ